MILKLIFPFLLTFTAFAQPYDEVTLHVQRLSERVITLTEDSPMENIVTAIASEKGIIVIDSSGSYITAQAMRMRIEKEFGRNDFAYLVNTHYHWDHSRGNQVFAEAVVVGHERCIAGMRADERSMMQRLDRREEFIDERMGRLEELEPGSEEAKDLAFSVRNHMCQKEGYRCTTPKVTFNDRMAIDCGDLTLELVFFGSAHSGSDILIRVPEEGILLTGDLFLDRGWLPLFSGMRELDVPRFIDSLSYMLDRDDCVKTVIPGHREVWPREKLELWRDYIVEIWEGVRSAREEGLGVEELMARLPLDERCRYTLELGHTEAELARFHEKNIHAFWRQGMKNAASMVEEAIASSGVEAGLEKYAELKSARKEVLFDETDFNALGYRLMQSGDLEAAIAVFELNVKAYPDSWNVHDSLAEAYMNAGRRESAIKLYRKSLELNPDNANGREMLKRME